MTKVDIMNSVSRGFHKVGFTLRKYSPEILVVAGVAGTVVSAVMACKATTKLSEILEEPKEQIEEIHSYIEENGYTEKYTEEDSRKDLAIVYAQTGLQLVKLYAPSVLLGAASIASILSGYKILNSRYVATAAAFAAVSDDYKGYRTRLIERFGKELDRELKYNLKTKEIEETIVNEDGSETTVKKTIEVMEHRPNDYSEYSIVYDEGNLGWDEDPVVSKRYLILQLNQANELLESRGYVILNEVYEMLGAQKTQAGQTVGWVRGEGVHIDFGMFETHRPKTRDFMNGYERCIVLDFNVTGDVRELFAKRAGGLA